ncbi:MAG: hypothetical protein J6L98_00110, partial [Bacteroidales bacterium]|nr:hypothetical protein [Bacteroidales bacterium]
MSNIINIVHCDIPEVGLRLKELSSGVEGVPSTPERQVFIVCDRNVRKLAEMIGLEAEGIFEIDATESNKDIGTVVGINRWLMEKGADRE